MTTTDKLSDEALENIVQGHFPAYEDSAAMARELLAHRRASQAAPAPSDGLRGLVVKPLEWEGKPSDCYMKAETILGHYRIYVQYSDEWTCDFEPSSGRPVNVRCWATTPDDCKAAAQADQDVRIRAALTPAPAQEGGE